MGNSSPRHRHSHSSSSHTALPTDPLMQPQQECRWPSRCQAGRMPPTTQAQHHSCLSLARHILLFKQGPCPFQPMPTCNAHQGSCKVRSCIQPQRMPSLLQMRKCTPSGPHSSWSTSFLAGFLWQLEPLSRFLASLLWQVALSRWLLGAAVSDHHKLLGTPHLPCKTLARGVQLQSCPPLPCGPRYGRISQWLWAEEHSTQDSACIRMG